MRNFNERNANVIRDVASLSLSLSFCRLVRVKKVYIESDTKPSHASSFIVLWVLQRPQFTEAP